MAYNETGKVIDWQAPRAFEATPQRVQDWVEEAVQEGEKWWDSQPAASSEKYLDLLSCKGPERLQTNNLKSDVRKFVETISDIREIATFGGADQFKTYIELFNGLVRFIYQDSMFPRQSRKALQYAVGLGRGYLWPRYIRKDFGWGPGAVEFVDLGPREVLPCQVPRNNDLEGAYVQTIIEPMGIAEAHARFPNNQEDLSPISKFKYASVNQVRRHEFWDRWKYSSESQDWERRYCEIRYTFVRDLSINRTGKLLQMPNKGEQAASWYYEVPSMGSVMAWTDPLNGLPASRLASREDARIYPQLRLIISNPGMNKPLYDGPAFDWHGMMPAVQYDVDDWPWLAVGYSLLHDIAGVEKAERGFVDLMYRVLRAKMNPPKGYDLGAGIPREDIKRLDWLDPDSPTIGIDGDPRKALQSLLPDTVDVRADDFKMVELFEKIRQKTLGLNDLASIAQLKFNLSSENFDKILETIGPIAKGISLNMQVAHSKIAHMLKYMIFQYFTTRKALSIVGVDGIAAEVFDFNPDALLPSHLPTDTDKKKPSESSRNQRAKWMAQNLVTKSVPSAIMQVTQMQEKMIYMNAAQRGWPVSFSTIFKKIGIDWPETPGKDEFEKYKTEQFELLDLKIKAAQVTSLEMPQPQGDKGGQGKGGGRPPSGKKPPKLEQRGKANGQMRTVVSQSE